MPGRKRKEGEKRRKRGRKERKKKEKKEKRKEKKRKRKKKRKKREKKGEEKGPPFKSPSSCVWTKSLIFFFGIRLFLFRYTRIQPNV